MLFLELAFTCDSATNAWRWRDATTRIQDWVQLNQLYKDYLRSKKTSLGPIFSYSFKAEIDDITGERNIVCGKSKYIILIFK